MTSAQLDREFPHQIILPAACYSGANYRFVHAFCVGLSLAALGHAVVKDGEWHHVFCFSKREDAEKLKQRFGGEWFNLETRGRGKSWAQLREPKKRNY